MSSILSIFPRIFSSPAVPAPNVRVFCQSCSSGRFYGPIFVRNGQFRRKVQKLYTSADKNGILNIQGKALPRCKRQFDHFVHPAAPDKTGGCPDGEYAHRGERNDDCETGAVGCKLRDDGFDWPDGYCPRREGTGQRNPRAGFFQGFYKSWSPPGNEGTGGNESPPSPRPSGNWKGGDTGMC